MKMVRAINVISAILFAMLGLILFSGCSGKDVAMQTVYQDVYIAVPCNVQVPEKPEPQANAVFAVIELKSYADRLLAALKACRGE